jgi:toxin ParE1/3/4
VRTAAVNFSVCSFAKANKYVFHAAARAEHFDHVLFYESRQRGLGANYRDEFEAAMVTICEMPERFRIEYLPEIRLFHLTRFPITLIFTLSANVVQILAVAHKRRRPGYWVARLH